MQFVEVRIQVPSSNADIIIAELNQAGYDSFHEVEDGIDAYVAEDIFEEATLLVLKAKYSDVIPFKYTFSLLEEKNWNAVWEQNFEPVSIGNKCIVRASFHSPGKHYEHDIVINPKMSFGTGHHATTYMMMEHLLEMDLKNHFVIDAGSGSGILAILASKLGAQQVFAFDIEDWAYHNCMENVQENHCPNVYVSQGTIASVKLPDIQFDDLVANINKNVLLEEIFVYSRFLKPSRRLLLSGFYSQDIIEIDQKASKHFSKVRQKIKDNWASVLYEKKSAT